MNLEKDQESRAGEVVGAGYGEVFTALRERTGRAGVEDVHPVWVFTDHDRARSAPRRDTHISTNTQVTKNALTISATIAATEGNHEGRPGYWSRASLRGPLILGMTGLVRERRKSDSLLCCEQFGEVGAEHAGRKPGDLAHLPKPLLRDLIPPDDGSTRQAELPPKPRDRALPGRVELQSRFDGFNSSEIGTNLGRDIGHDRH